MDTIKVRDAVAQGALEAIANTQQHYSNFPATGVYSRPLGV
jgi:hypothetical protein